MFGQATGLHGIGYNFSFCQIATGRLMIDVFPYAGQLHGLLWKYLLATLKSSSLHDWGNLEVSPGGIRHIWAKRPTHLQWKWNVQGLLLVFARKVYQQTNDPRLTVLHQTLFISALGGLESFF